MMRRHGLALVAFAAMVALALPACGGGSDEGSGDGGAEIPTGAGGEGTTIAVSLGEDGPDSMYMNLNQPSVPAGSVTFVVTNEGQKEHEFIVLRTDTPAGDFPIMPEDHATGAAEEEMGHGHDIDETAPGIEVVGEIEDIQAGATEEVTFTLEPGHYALICNLRDHYSSGMWADFDVT